jgi:hypothetical protein
MKILMISLLSLLGSYLYPIAPGGHRLTQQEAERILGEACQLKESSTSAQGGGHQFKSTYLAQSSDEQAGKIVALYYGFDSYASEAEAKKLFDTFKTSNQQRLGFETLTHLGDEAFFHTDNQHFGLVIARKGNEIIRIKINLITPKTSFEALKQVAAEVVRRV